MKIFYKTINKLCQLLNNRLFLGKSKRHIRRKISKFGYPYMLHLGCGKVKFNDWINIDLGKSGGVADFVWDLTHGIPFDDSSCQLIYCEHLLEHFAVEQGVSLLRECWRVLKTEGILRVAMPSLDVLIEKSERGDWHRQDWLSWPEYRFVKTRAEMLNMAFREWGHKWLYDREELHRRLSEAGFTKIKDVEWGRSDSLKLRNRESRRDSLLICEAKK